MQPQVSLIDTPAALAPHTRAWDALALAAGRPYCAPGWMLPWWRHAAPSGALLRTVVAIEGGELIGIAPLFAARGAIGPTYRLLGSPIAPRTELLAAAGRAEAAAAAFAQALAEADPRPAAVSFRELPPGSPWPGLLADAWPGRAPRVLHEDTIAAPTVGLDGLDYDAYMASLRSKLRGKLRRDRRQLEEQGARYRMLTEPHELRPALAEFARLHHGRWDDRGGSAALGPGVERMLAEAADELGPAGRLRIFTIELDGRAIASQLCVAAGGELVYWLGGFDPDFARNGPGNQALLAAIADGLQRGERRLDLGPGTQEYKLRLADGEDILESVTLVTRPGRYPLARTLGLARDARARASERLPDAVKHPVRSLRRRWAARG